MSKLLDDETDVDARRVLRRAISRLRERQSRHLSDDRPVVIDPGYEILPHPRRQSLSTRGANFATAARPPMASAVFLLSTWRRVT